MWELAPESLRMRIDERRFQDFTGIIRSWVHETALDFSLSFCICLKFTVKKKKELLNLKESISEIQTIKQGQLNSRDNHLLTWYYVIYQIMCVFAALNLYYTIQRVSKLFFSLIVMSWIPLPYKKLFLFTLPSTGLRGQFPLRSHHHWVLAIIFISALLTS